MVHIDKRSYTFATDLLPSAGTFLRLAFVLHSLHIRKEIHKVRLWEWKLSLVARLISFSSIFYVYYGYNFFLFEYWKTTRHEYILTALRVSWTGSDDLLLFIVTTQLFAQHVRFISSHLFSLSISLFLCISIYLRLDWVFVWNWKW